MNQLTLKLDEKGTELIELRNGDSMPPVILRYTRHFTPKEITDSYEIRDPFLSRANAEIRRYYLKNNCAPQEIVLSADIKRGFILSDEKIKVESIN